MKRSLLFFDDESATTKRRALCLHADGLDHNDIDGDDVPANDVEPESVTGTPRDGCSLDLSTVAPRGRHRGSTTRVRWCA